MARTLEQWRKEVNQDVSLIVYHLKEAAENEDGLRARHLAIARKEARRLERDIERIGSEVYGISKEEIDQQGPL